MKKKYTVIDYLKEPQTFYEGFSPFKAPPWRIILYWLLFVCGITWIMLNYADTWMLDTYKPIIVYGTIFIIIYNVLRYFYRRQQVLSNTKNKKRF